MKAEKYITRGNVLFKSKLELINELIESGHSKNQAIELVDNGYSDIKYPLKVSGNSLFAWELANQKEFARIGCGNYSPSDVTYD